MEREVPDYQAEKLKSQGKRKRSNRRGFVKKLFFGFATIFASFLYLRFESNWLEITRKKVIVPKLKNKVPIKILHLSDLHFSSSGSLDEIDIALREGFSLSPDACVITGDFITDKISDEDLLQFSKLLSKYASRIPTFASLGNHDGGEWAASRGGFTSSKEVEKLLLNSRIKLLHNQRESIYLKGQILSISGVGDLWSKTCLPQKCLPPQTSQSNSGPLSYCAITPTLKKSWTPTNGT